MLRCWLSRSRYSCELSNPAALSKRLACANHKTASVLDALHTVLAIHTKYVLILHAKNATLTQRKLSKFYLKVFYA